MPELVGKVVVVTGGAKGLGWSTVEAFVAEGALPAILDCDRDALCHASSYLVERGIEHLALEVDIAQEAAVESAFEAVMSRFARVDVLINNAGIARRRPSIDLPLTDWQAVIDVNLTAVFLCSRVFARTVIDAEGACIVNVSSIMGLSGGGIVPNISYQASKGALVNLTRALAVEWAARGIRVNAVAPTWVSTELTRELIADPLTLARMLDLTPMRRLPEPSDVASAIVFLASGGARMITGHTLPVDGGYLAQ